MRLMALIAACCALLAASAQRPGDGTPNRAVFHGGVQSDILFPQDDYTIGTEKYDSRILTNSYANASVFSKYVDGGLRVEYLQHPLPGFEPQFRGWGVPNFYVKGKFRGMELTGGDFYEQFGSGFILRTYEDRSLGIDNSIRGGRLKLNNIRGLQLTALGGVQRCFWDWNTHSYLAGANADVHLEDYLGALSRRNLVWTAGASYVFKHQRDETIVVPGTNYRLHLPLDVNAWEARTQLARGTWSAMAEYAWKSPDPSADNNYTYRHGDALMVSGSYSTRSVSVLVQAKRSENMAFRSRRSQTLTGAFINNMPPFAYPHTYALAAMYPYATQAAPGEWAFQGNFGYNFRRKTALGGRYGTKLRLNLSYIRGLRRDDEPPLFNGSQFGTDGAPTRFFGFGDVYYQDINLQVEKKVTPALHVNAMYMYQRYNQHVIEGHGGIVNAHIGVADIRWRINRRLTLRTEVQYLGTRQDKGDWAYGLLEVSVLPYLMFSASDMWNCGDTGTHYYMFTATGNYRSNRLMVGYGRTRAGYNCSGGVCRYVPASRGFQISYNYTF